MRQFTQVNRRLRFHCDAAGGDDVLQLVGFRGVEEMSQPFVFTLELISNSPDVRPTDIVGQRASFAIVLPDTADTERWFDGFVSRFSYLGTDDRAGISRYQAQIVPWTWSMGLTSDCRIFQNRSIPEIVREVLGECPHVSFDDTDVELSAHPKLEYCVQYRETDLNFVSRLLERAGIFYYFTHRLGEHKLVLADSKSGYVDCVESEVGFHGTRSEAPDEDMLIAWERRAEFRSGAIAGTDYNYKNPSTDLGATASTTMPLAGARDLELFEYPGNYPDTRQGDDVVNLRMEEQEATHDVVAGRGRCCTWHCGGRFTVTSHQKPAEEGKSWALVRINHEAELAGAYITESAMSSAGESEGGSYSNAFVCIPAGTTFRPPRRTPRPVVGGMQTAVVVGENGQEIQVDDLGRIRLQFFWDRRGNRRADASRWVRVAQAWAGPGYGSWFLPRVGHEVVVAFEDGDPDRPLVVGSVYHAENQNPYVQPGNKTQSGIRTRSSQGGSARNYNEIRFEDKKGSEQLSIQAEKDKQVLVKNNNNETVGVDEQLIVGNNRTKSIGNDELTTIGVNRTESVGGNETITITGNRTESVVGSETITINALRTENVGASETVNVAASRTHSVGATDSLTVGAARSQKVGVAENVATGVLRTSQTGLAEIATVGVGKISVVGVQRIALVGVGDAVMVGGNSSLTCGGDHTVSASGNVGIKAGGMLVLECPDITLKAGGGFVRINGEGVTIVGNIVKINSGGAPGALGGGAAGGAGAGTGGSSGSASASGSSGAGAANPTSAGGAGGGGPLGCFGGGPGSPMSTLAGLAKSLPPGMLPPGAGDVLQSLASGQIPSLGSLVNSIPPGVLPPNLQAALSAGSQAMGALSSMSGANAGDGSDTFNDAGVGVSGGISGSNPQFTRTVNDRNGNPVNVADDPTLDEVNGRSFPHDGRPDLDYILVNPNSPYPNDAIEQHELAHLEAYHDGTRDEEAQELIATERGHDYAMQRYRETNDPKYFDYAEFQRNKHNTIKLPGVDSQGNFSLHQLFDDAVNKVTGNGSGTDFIR